MDALVDVAELEFGKKVLEADVSSVFCPSVAGASLEMTFEAPKVFKVIAARVNDSKTDAF